MTFTTDCSPNLHHYNHGHLHDAREMKEPTHFWHVHFPNRYRLGLTLAGVCVYMTTST